MGSRFREAQFTDSAPAQIEQRVGSREVEQAFLPPRKLRSDALEPRRFQKNPATRRTDPAQTDVFSAAPRAWHRGRHTRSAMWTLEYRPGMPASVLAVPIEAFISSRTLPWRR